MDNVNVLFSDETNFIVFLTSVGVTMWRSPKEAYNLDCCMVGFGCNIVALTRPTTGASQATLANHSEVYKGCNVHKHDGSVRTLVLAARFGMVLIQQVFFFLISDCSKLGSPFT